MASITAETNLLIQEFAQGEIDRLKQFDNLGNWQEVIDITTAALGLIEPSQQARSELLVQRGHAHLRSGNHQAAREDFNTVVTESYANTHPDTKALGYIGLAEVVRVEGGDFSQAANYLTTALKLTSQNSFAEATAYKQLGLVELAQDNPQAAQLHLRTAQRIANHLEQPNQGLLTVGQIANRVLTSLP